MEPLYTQMRKSRRAVGRAADVVKADRGAAVRPEVVGVRFRLIHHLRRTS
jgi:hypothetical protein